jgi:hypothetical protein
MDTNNYHIEPKDLPEGYLSRYIREVYESSFFHRDKKGLPCFCRDPLCNGDPYRKIPGISFEEFKEIWLQGYFVNNLDRNGLTY